MKKHLLIASLICVTTNVPAYAVVKCISLSANHTCTFSNPQFAYLRQPDWSVTCKRSANDTTGTNVTGIAICSNTIGNSVGQTATDLDLSSSAIDMYNIYCWCKMNNPAVSRWVYANKYNTGATCANSCANRCAYSTGNFSFKTSIFNNLSD